MFYDYFEDRVNLELKALMEAFRFGLFMIPHVVLYTLISYVMNTFMLQPCILAIIENITFSSSLNADSKTLINSK